MFGAVFKQQHSGEKPDNRHAEHGQSYGGDWHSDRSYQNHGSDIAEKNPYTEERETSKRQIWRLVRLGLSIVLTIAALVLTLIVLVVGRYGNGGSELSLITVNMTSFAKFEAPTIELVHNSTSATKTKRDLGSFVSDVASAADSVETYVSGAASAVESAAESVGTAIAAEAESIIDEIGDDLADIEDAIVGLMDYILDAIQDQLNSWLNETTSILSDLDIPEQMSLHLTTFCSTGSGSGSDSSNSSSSSTSCSQLFSSGGSDTFNATENNGTIFGFQPGNVISKALGVFYVPTSAQEDIRSPVDRAANSVEKLIQNAGDELSSWSINILFIPIVAVYALACVFAGLLLVLLVAAAAYSVRGGGEPLPPRIYSLCGTVALLAAFFLLLGSVIVTVIGLVAWVLDLCLSVVDISISSGTTLKWLSWGSFFIMAFVAVTLKVEEYVAECLFWWRFLRKLLRGGKKEGGVSGLMKGF